MRDKKLKEIPAKNIEECGKSVPATHPRVWRHTRHKTRRPPEGAPRTWDPPADGSVPRWSTFTGRWNKLLACI